MSLQLDPASRAGLWRRLAEILEEYAGNVDNLRVSPEMDPRTVRAEVAAFDFRKPLDSLEALETIVRNLNRHQVHSANARYFGLFNPAPTTMGIAADALGAAFNCQLAAWSHSPFGVEAEQHLIRCFGERFGYDPRQTDGAFCTGGAEANHTALLTALTRTFPDYGVQGLRSLPSQPVFYVSAQGHHSFLKAVRAVGLGAGAMRQIAVDRNLRMIPKELERAIAQDRAAGFAPFLVAATAGTTNAGAIDPLPVLAEIARGRNLWFHVDAAWGGAAALVPELRPLLDGVEASDSITFDAHKWLSVPMGAGIFLTRHGDIMDRTFRIQTAYMPREAADLDIVEPYQHTMQWSRRFIGLKVLLSLLTAGWDGYAEAIRNQTAMGDLLRSRLRDSGWRIENDTPLPVVCFSGPPGVDPHQVAMDVVSSGEAWISTTVLGAGPVLRACITNYRSQPADIEALIQALDRAVSRTAPAVELSSSSHG